LELSDILMSVVLIILLYLSSFFSSSETALTTVNKIKIKKLCDEGNKSALIVDKLLSNPSKMLSVILVGNNIVNISASSIATVFATTLCSRHNVPDAASVGAGLSTGVLTFLVLIFGEITPKSKATINAEKIALKNAKYINGLSYILTPICFIVDSLANLLLRLLGVNMNVETALITEKELRAIVDVSHEEGVIESEERKMITNIVDFGDSVAKDIMVPQIDICYIDADATYEELMEAFNKDKFSRMPVYKDSKDNIIGIINLKDIFFYQKDIENFNIEELIRKPHYTFEFKKTSELFVEMKKDSIPISIVLDEYGSTAGLITMEDLIEEIVGEIRDEYDYDEEDLIKSITDKKFIIDGSAKLEDINETLNLSLESDSYDSLAGHILFLLSHIPLEGEKLSHEGVTYTVKKLDKNRIEKVLVELE